MSDGIPFNKPFLTGLELEYIQKAYTNGHLSGDGDFTKKCHQWLEQTTLSTKALLTHSCTAALEMAALLLDIKSGDEIIMPSFTFVSTANAFVLRGGIPVFVDIKPETQNIDEVKIEQAITSKTKAIVPVHYAGVSCEMDSIMEIAKKYKLLVIEDAAQGVMASYKDKPLGSIGEFGTLSFHETKNVISGEGGALLVNHQDYILDAEIIREKGTNRSQFFRGQVDKYTWQEVGSSYLPSELIAAFLWAQLQRAEDITKNRIESWNYYRQELQGLYSSEKLVAPHVPDYCQHNAHMYYSLVSSKYSRSKLLEKFKEAEILTVFHYVPLHASPAGRKYARVSGNMEITNKNSEQLIRLPLWPGITCNQQDKVLEVLTQFLK